MLRYSLLNFRVSFARFEKKHITNSPVNFFLTRTVKCENVSVAKGLEKAYLHYLPRCLGHLIAGSLLICGSNSLHTHKNNERKNELHT